MVERTEAGLELVVDGRKLGRISSNASGICGISHGDGLGMLVLGMMLFGVDLFVFLEILGTFEGLLANFADVGLERSVDCVDDDDEQR